MSDRGYVRRRCRKCGVAMGSSDTTCSGKKEQHKVGREGGWGYVLETTPPGTPKGGDRKRITKGGFKTAKEAGAALTLLEQERATGAYVEPSRLLLGDYLKQWVKSVEVRESTRTTMEVHIRRHLIPALGDVPLQSLTRQQVKECWANLRQVNGKPMADHTKHKNAMTLSKALADAVADGLLKSNPAAKTMKSPESDKEMAVWSESQVRDFLASVRDDENYALYRLALMSGARRGELLGLKWDDVDLLSGTVTFHRQISKQGVSGAIEGPTKTKRSRRTIDIDPATVDAMIEHSAKQAGLRLKAGPAWEDHGYVFTRADGKALHPDGASLRWNRRVKASGLPRIRFHDTRHTSATLLLKAGVSAHVVSQRLGHSSVAFTLQQYAHVLPQQGADAVAKLAALVDSPHGGVGSASDEQILDVKSLGESANVQ